MGFMAMVRNVTELTMVKTINQNHCWIQTRSTKRKENSRMAKLQIFRLDRISIASTI